MPRKALTCATFGKLVSISGYNNKNTPSLAQGLFVDICNIIAKNNVIQRALFLRKPRILAQKHDFCAVRSVIFLKNFCQLNK
jgi:hypothetical protein